MVSNAPKCCSLATMLVSRAARKAFSKELSVLAHTSQGSLRDGDRSPLRTQCVSFIARTVYIYTGGMAIESPAFSTATKTGPGIDRAVDEVGGTMRHLMQQVRPIARERRHLGMGQISSDRGR